MAFLSPSNKNFNPTDEELIILLYNKVHNKPMPEEATIVEFDLYGQMNPWEIWEAFGGSNGQDLYFFTTLKKKYPNGSRMSRTIGCGSWEVENGGKPIREDQTKRCVALKKRYRFWKSDTIHDGGWILHEFTLDSSLLCDPSANNYVVCRFRENQMFEFQAQQIANADHTNNQTNNRRRRRTTTRSMNERLQVQRNNNRTKQQRRRTTALVLHAITQTENNNVYLRDEINQGQTSLISECAHNEEDGEESKSCPEFFPDQLLAFEDDLMEEETPLHPIPFYLDLLLERIDEKSFGKSSYLMNY